MMLLLAACPSLMDSDAACFGLCLGPV
jgi:hypothetical protein